MNTPTWMFLAAGFFMGTIALIHFLTTPKTSHTLTSSDACNPVMRTLFSVFVFSGVLLDMMPTTLAVIYFPAIIWKSRPPKDDDVA